MFQRLKVYMNNLINKSLQVLILCGGKGERLRPLTETIPKPLIKIKNKPILSYVIKHLKSYDLNRYIFATGYKSNILHTFIKKNDNGLSIKIIDSGDVDIIKRIQDASIYIENGSGHFNNKYKSEKLKLNSHYLKFNFNGQEYEFKSILPSHFLDFMKKNNLYIKLDKYINNFL